MIRISQLKVNIDEDKDILPSLIAKKLKIKATDITSYRIYKESIDARRGTVTFVYTVDANIANEESILAKKLPDITTSPDLTYKIPFHFKKPVKERPVIIGFGPTGIFAALLLAESGLRPIVLERGEDVDARVNSVENFFFKGILNPSSNVQFGEGGAGTFSDGKLTTRVKDLRGRKVLEELVVAGAPKEILYTSHPHVGTDLLREVIKNIRKKIVALGGEVHFNVRVDDILIENNQLHGLITDNGKTYKTSYVILAVGHSARDTFELIHDKNIDIQSKPFAVGARIEHPQALVDKAQYKEFANHPKLNAAEYRLTHQSANGRGVYTFCMCPGGIVVPSSSEVGGVVTNGMSEHARDATNANSAILVQVTKEDFNDNHPLAGVEFQRQLEQKAFDLAGSTYKAPAQRVGDYLSNVNSDTTKLGDVLPSYPIGVTMTNLNDLFPSYVNESLKEGLRAFDKKLKGFSMSDAILTGVETRSSSPVRITRDPETLQSISVSGLYPAGEGAGYAGGIVSSAIDGLKCAEALILAIKQLEEVI